MTPEPKEMPDLIKKSDVTAKDKEMEGIAYCRKPRKLGI